MGWASGCESLPRLLGSIQAVTIQTLKGVFWGSEECTFWAFFEQCSISTLVAVRASAFVVEGPSCS